MLVFRKIWYALFSCHLKVNPKIRCEITTISLLAYIEHFLIKAFRCFLKSVDVVERSNFYQQLGIIHLLGSQIFPED